MKQEQANIPTLPTQPTQLHTANPVQKVMPVQTVPRQSVAKSMPHKGLVVGGICVFLFALVLLIPARFVPGSSLILNRIDLTDIEPDSLTLGRVLYLWAAQGFPLSSLEARSLSVFNRSQDQSVQAGDPKSGLFDLKAVNSSRRARGLSPDGLAGAYVEGEDENVPAAFNRRVNGWSAEASQAADKAAKNQEVYFGEDATVAARSAAHSTLTGGSADTARMHGKTPLALAPAADVVGNAADSLSTATDASLTLALAKAANVSPAQIKSGSAVDQKAQQDLAHVFESSTVAEQIPSLQKRQLATAGYMGGSLQVASSQDTPAGAATVSLYGNEKMAPPAAPAVTEEQCRAQAKQADEKLGPVLERAAQLIRQIRQGVPQGCGGELSNWKTSLIHVREQCQTVKKTFIMMKNNCAMNIAKEGSCETIYLNSYAEDLSQACEALTDAKAQVPQDKSQIAQLTKDVQQIVADFDRVQLDNSFNLKVDGVVGTNDFFPQTDNTQWLQGRGDN